MKYLFRIFPLFGVVLSLTSCTLKGNDGSAAGGAVTSLVIRLDSFSEPIWSKGDKVAVIDNIEPDRVREFTVVRLGKDATTGRLNGTAILHGNAAEGASSFRIVSPFSAVTGVSGGKIGLRFPSVQHIASIDRLTDVSSLVCYGTGAGEVTLRPLSSMLKFSISRSDINRIELHSVSAAPWAGEGAIDASGALSDLGKEGPFDLVVKPAGVDFILPGEYYIPLRPGVHSGGWWMNLYTTDAKQLVLSRTASAEFVSGQTQDLGLVGASDPVGVYYGGPGGTKTSSTVNFYWHNSASSSMPSIDNSRGVPWRLALYRDEDCSDLVVCHTLPANAKDASGNFVFLSGEPRFLFAGLEAGKPYWFRATDMSTFLTTKLMTATTSAFEPVTMKQTDAGAGDVILAEDFSELAWFGDVINGGGSTGCAGYASMDAYKPGSMTPATEGFVKAEGYSPTPITYFNYNEEGRLFTYLKGLLPYTRLSDWSELREVSSSSPTCARPGYLKLGAQSTASLIVTPAIDCIPQGKSATVKLTFNAAYANYAAKERFGMAELVSGTVDQNRVFTPSAVRQKFSFVPSQLWGGQTFIFQGVCKGDRIAIGGDREAAGTVSGSDQLRICIDNIVLQVQEISEVTPIASQIGFSDAVISMPRVNGATRFAVYLNGTRYGDTTGEYMAVSSLRSGTDYEALVKAYDAASTEIYSGSTSFHTAAVRQNTGSTGPTFVSIGWDQLFRTETDGVKQAYQVQLCSDAACSNVIYDFVPQTGQNNAEKSVFGNGGVLGKAAGVDQGDVQGGYLECSNYMTPTGVSIGGLSPNMTYYVRVRTRKSVSAPIYKTKGTLSTTYTLTHAFGDGGWSDPVPVRTDAKHQAGTLEVIRCGFDDFCVQQDYANRCPGSVPYAYKHNLALSDCTFAYANASNYGKEFCFYVHNTAVHQSDTWGLTAATTESDLCYNGGTTWADRPILKGLSSGGNVVTGDFAGWFCGQLARPYMGQLGLENTGCFVATPQLSRNLSASGTACTLSLHAVAKLYYSTSGLAPLAIYVWRTATKSFDEMVQYVRADNLYPWQDGSSSALHYNDYSKRDEKRFSFDLTLYPGDAVWIQNTGVETIIIDDILIVKK